MAVDLKNEHPKSRVNKDDLPQESADALIKSLVKVVRDNAAIEISVRREGVPTPERNLSRFVVTLPEGVTAEQRAEADYWINEMTGLYRYAKE